MMGSENAERRQLVPSSSGTIHDPEAATTTTRSWTWYLTFGLQDQASAPFEAKDKFQDDLDSNVPWRSWKWYHTVTVLVIRMIVDFTFKNPLVFWLDYQDALGLTNYQYAAIMTASEVGAILAIFVKSSNVIALSDQTLMVVSLLFCGVATIALPGFTVFYGDEYIIGTIVWCSVCRVLVGVTFAFISAASIKIAADYVERPEYVTQIISVLHYSWPVSNALNVVFGFVIDGMSWEYVFLLTGIALIVVAALAMLMFWCFSLNAGPESAQHAEQTAQRSEPTMSSGDQLRILFTDWKSVIIILTSFAMTFRSRSIYIVTASVWMEDTYSLGAVRVGLSTLYTVLGEVIGLALMSALAHRLQLGFSALSTLSGQLVVSSLLIVFSAIYGNNITLGGAFLFICLLTMTHEAFYVVQQSNAIKYAPANLKFLLLLGERMAQETGSILAIFTSVLLWDESGSHALLVFSVIWLGGVFLECFVLVIYAPMGAPASSQGGDKPIPSKDL